MLNYYGTQADQSVYMISENAAVPLSDTPNFLPIRKYQRENYNGNIISQLMGGSEFLRRIFPNVTRR